MGEPTNIPPASHSDRAADNPVHETNGVQMRPNKGDKNQDEQQFNTTTTATPVFTPVQDITSHMISHSSYQQPWCSEDSGQILSYDLPSQLETETKSIMIFHDYMELCADMYHYSSDVCPHAVPSSVLPVPLINPVQESCGQSDTNNSYQTSLVSNEEHFEIFPSNRT